MLREVPRIACKIPGVVVGRSLFRFRRDGFMPGCIGVGCRRFGVVLASEFHVIRRG
jgi:hypothetical protein